jgi:uncharacterized protein
MSLKEQITADLTTAMKARDELATSTLRMIKADFMKYEVSGAGKVATNEVIVDLLGKAVKQRREAADGFEKGGNVQAAQKERDEITIIQKYLPEQLGENELREVVQGVIDQMSAGSADFGKVMGATMGKIKGKADGNVVGAVVKSLLS